MLEMKKLLLLLLLPLISTQGLTEDNKVYFCNETKNIFIDTENDTFKNYTKDSFQFFIEDEIITLIGPSFYPSTKIDVRREWSGEIFANTHERTLVYKDGNFHWTYMFLHGVSVISAKCRTL